MLQKFNDVGFIMWHDRPGARELVVLDVQWMLDQMTALLCTRSLQQKAEESTTMRATQWDDLRLRGRHGGRRRETGRREAGRWRLRRGCVQIRGSSREKREGGQHRGSAARGGPSDVGVVGRELRAHGAQRSALGIGELRRQ